jgi:ligand-binding sensor domain-containing protein
MRVKAVLQALGLLTSVSIVVDAERLPIKIYTTGDGLAHNAVHRIVRDSRGFLWFCTFEGLSRFDGYSFATYGVEHGLASPVANDLLETRSGQYWIATSAGLCRFNPRGIPQRRSTNDTPESAAANAMFTVYYPGSDEESRNVLSLFEDSRGAIWCGTHGGLYRLDQQNHGLTFRSIDLGTPNDYKANNHINSIIEDGRGVVWVGSSSGIYQLLPDRRPQRYSSERNGLPDNTIHSLLADREGWGWARSRVRRRQGQIAGKLVGPFGVLVNPCLDDVNLLLALFLELIVAIVSQVPPQQSTPEWPRQFLPWRW